MLTISCMEDMNEWVIGFIDWNLMPDSLQGLNHAGSHAGV